MGIKANWGTLGKDQPGEIQEYEPLPEGLYVCSVEDVIQKPWKDKTGKEYGKLEVKLIVESGPAKKGLHLWDWLYLSPSSLWKLSWFATYCGLTLKDGDELETFHLRGLAIGCEVMHEEYNGKKRAKINRYIRADEIAQEQAASVKANTPLVAIMKDSDVPFGFLTVLIPALGVAASMMC